MIRILLTTILLFCFSAGYISAQNVGVDVASPVEKLDVLGAIRIGNTSNTNAGAIRWNSPNFQGYDGTQWVNFGGGTLTGSGTTNYLPKWTSSTALGNSILYDNGSNLGIGTSSPNNNAELVGTNNTVNFGILKTGNNWIELFAGSTVGGTGTGIIFDNSSFFRVGSSATRQNSSPTEFLRITSAGNVGVGTTNPDAKMHVAYGSGGTGLGVGLRVIGNGKQAGFPDLYAVADFRGDLGPSSDFEHMFAKTVNISNLGTNGRVVRLQFTEATEPNTMCLSQLESAYNSGLPYLAFRTSTGPGNITEKMRITAGGNVGIGITVPLFKLDVYASNASQARIGSAEIGGWPANSVHAMFGNQALDHTAQGNYALLQAQNGTTYINAATGQDINFREGNLPKMILSGGNLGIGTISPSEKLEVNGQVKITGGTPGLNKVLRSDAAGLATWVDPNTLITDDTNTLDEAYDEGGVGAGRQITADNGAVRINGDDGFIVTGAFGSGDAIEVTGAGTRMFFNPKKAALRAGQTFGNEWDDANIGTYSVGLGYYAQATNNGAIAIGSITSSTGFNTVALGSNTTANANYAIAIGTNTMASGQNSFAAGSGATSSGSFSSALGHNNTSSGSESFAIGQNSIASGTNSFAGGLNNTAPSYGETVLGINATSTSPSSTSAFAATDRLLTVGNGTSTSARSDAFVVLKNGNTGIGNITPGAKLEVAGQVKITGGTPGAGKVLTDVGGSGLATWVDPNTLVNGDNLGDHTATQNIELNGNWLSNDGGSEGIRVDNNGNIGIGLVPGSAYLDITGTNAGTSSLQLRSGNTGNGTSSNQLLFGYSGAETYRHAIKTRHNSSGITNNSIDFYLWDYANDAVGTVGTNAVMTIAGDLGGSVGIGTTNPSSALDVRRSSDTDGDAITFGTSTYFMGRLGETATTNKVYIANTYNSDASFIDFRLKGNAESNSKMIIKGDGNVGIGQSNPSATLDVVGTVEVFGAWTSRSANTVYQAATDGFIVAWAGSAYFRVKTDASSTPTTVRLEAEGAASNAARPNVMCPVKKGDYWTVEGVSGGTPTVWWMPLGQ